MKECMLKYFKKTMALVLAVGILVSSVPNLVQLVHAADVTEVTPSIDSRSNTSGAAGFWFTVSPADPLPATGGWATYKGSCVYVGGDLKTNVPLFKATENLYYVGLADASLSATVGTIVTIDGRIESGNEAVVFKKTNFQYQADGKWHELLNETEVTPSIDSRSNTSGAAGFWFTVSPADPLPATGGWATYKGSCVYVGGDLKTNVPLFKATENLYYVGLADASLSATVGTIVTIDGRIESGKEAVVFKKTSFQYQADGKWHELLNETEVTPSIDSRSNTSGTDGFYFTVSPADPLPSTEDWKTKYSGSCVYINEQLQTNVKLIKILSDLYYVELANTSQSVSTNTIVTIDGRIESGKEAVVFKKTSFQYQADGKWHEIVENTKVDTALDPQRKSTTDGIYLVTTPADLLPSAENWQTKYSGECVYVDGELNTKVKLIKILSDLYYVDLAAASVSVKEGTKIKLSGTITDGTCVVEFLEKTYVYTLDNGWEVDGSIETQYLATAISTKTSASEIWVNSVGTDKLDFADTNNDGSGWKGYSGIVYVNGNLTSTKIYKNLSDLYVIYASDLGVTVVDGLQVKVMGALTDNTNQIYYLPITFEYSESAGKWVLVRNASTDVPGDANADGQFSVADVIRAKYEELMGDASKRLVSEGALYEDAFGKKTVNVKKLYEIALASEDGVPVYVDDDTIMIAAYEGPKAAGSILYDKGVQSDTLKAELTQEDFNQFARAGLNTLIVESPTFVSVSGGGDYDLMGSGGGHWTTLTNHMEKAANANLNVIASSEALNSYLWEEQATHANGTTKIDVTDTFLKRDLRQLLTGMVQQSSGQYRIAKGMLEYNNFKGILMGDELPYAHFDAYKKAHDILEELDDSVLTFNSQFAGINEKTGKSWAEEYGPVAGTFCYDMYPYVKDGSMKKDWLYNLQLSAAEGLQHGFTTGITLQAHGQTISRTDSLVEDTSLGLRDPNEKDDIGFQVYTSLAYGMKYLSYYTYAPHRKQNNKHYYTGTMIEYDENQNIVETDTYRAVQAVNNDILQFDHVFLDYDWRGTIGISKQNKDKLFGQLENYSTSTIGSYEATHDALIGCMYDPDKKLNGYWLVNAVDPQDNQSNEVTVEFTGKTRVIVYNPSKGIYGEIQELNNSTYTAELGSGEGQFVIPLS